MKPRHPVARWLQIAAGILLWLLIPIVGPIPGPGGIFLFAGGLVLILRNSHWARMRWARIKRRWPKIGNAADRIMRRGSAQRRRQRAREQLG
jgi:hypothetical protein